VEARKTGGAIKKGLFRPLNEMKPNPPVPCEMDNGELRCLNSLPA